MHFEKKRLGLNTINKLGIINLIANLAFASVATIWAIYLNSFLNNESLVGLIISIYTIIGMLSFFFIIPIIEEHRKHKIYIFSLFLYVLSYLILAFMTKIYIILLIGAILSIAVTLRISAFGIIVKDKSTKKTLSKNEGFIYTAFNIAWLIGPLIAGFIASRYGINKVFILGSLICLLSIFLVSLFRVRDSKIEKKIDWNVIKNIKDFFKDKNRTLAYLVSGGVSFWFTLIYIFMPMHIVKSGLGNHIVGYFLFATVVPLVLSEYYFGKLAGKIGFKKIFVIGYLILTISALVSFFLTNMYLIMAILVIGSLGVSMLEPTTEAYFFDIIPKKQREKYYCPYNTTLDINTFLGSFLSAAFLFLFPFKFIFILFAVIMFIFVIISRKVKDVIEAKKK